MNWLNWIEPSPRGNCSSLTCGIKPCISDSCLNNEGHWEDVGINLVISILNNKKGEWNEACCRKLFSCFFDSFADYMARLDPSKRIFARSSPVDHLLY